MLEHIEKLAAFGSEIPAWRRDIDTSGGAEGGLGLAAIAFDMVERIDREFEAAVRGIEADPKLSTIGRRHKIATLAGQALERLGTVRRHVARLNEEIDEFLSGKASDARASDTVRAAIWRWLERLDPLQVELAYRQAIAAGDWSTTDAIESLPVVHPARLEADRLEELRSERMRATNPKMTRNVEVLAGAVRDVGERAHALESRLLELIRSGERGGDDVSLPSGNDRVAPDLLGDIA